MAHGKVYSYVQEKILALLEKGVNPWAKGWNPEAGMNRNGRTGHIYRGVNVWITGCSGFSSNFWFSRKDVQKMGGKIKTGEKGTMIVYFRFLEKEKGNPSAGKFPMLKYYLTWNLEQTENIKVSDKISQLKDFEEIESAEDILSKSSVRPQVRHGGLKACYSPALDIINMPEKGVFNGNEEYYSVMFHELAHSTGHKSRLSRDMSGTFGNNSYTKEELIAEMTSAFLCAVAKIDNTIENSASYIDGWKNKIKSDASLVVSAAAAAQKASDMILNVKFDK